MSTGAAPRNSFTICGELADHSGARLPRVDPQAHVLPLGDRLEGRDVERDQLRLALLVIDSALDDQDAVGDAELGAFA